MDRLGPPSSADVPLLGSPQFDRLDWDDPLRLASTVRAAGAWWYDGRPERIAERLRDELAVMDQLADDEFARVAARVRRLADKPSHQELLRRWAS